ncbi:hypothetical protein KFE94_07555 [bacterium SCSIO 12643]|nr:hypothetical protein KFE94_07555 [bacterium SCSIO 12643]
MEQFYFGMKVSLNDEIGIVIRVEINSDWDKEPGIIRWDTNKEFDSEDWRGMFESFKDSGGKEIDPKTKFKYINEKGELIK